MLYEDYDWIQWAIEQWFEFPTARKTGGRKWHTVVRATSSYLLVGNAPAGMKATRENAERIAKKWIENNQCGINDGMALKPAPWSFPNFDWA